MALNWFNLEGKVALVTGSGTGIGAAIAKGLAASGADVACHDLKDFARGTSEEIRAMGRRSIPLSADLSKRPEQEGLVAAAMKEFGRIDILVNNAGMIRRAPAVDYSDEDWDLLLEVNLSAPFRLSRRVGKLMLEQGGGRIVNIASLLAFQGGILVPAYAASKGGVAQFTKALANEWAARNIHVNALAPGYFDTEMCAAIINDPVREPKIRDRIPAGRWGRAEDLVGPLLFLASDASNYVDGHVLVVDGGWLAR